MFFILKPSKMGFYLGISRVRLTTVRVFKEFIKIVNSLNKKGVEGNFEIRRDPIQWGAGKFSD